MSSGDGRDLRLGGGAGVQKMRRRRRYSEAQDLELLRTITSVEAHLAPYGEKMRRFADTAERLNESQLFPWQVDAKNCLERFNLLVELHKRKDRRSAPARVKADFDSREGMLDEVVSQLRMMQASKEAEKLSTRRKDEGGAMSSKENRKLKSGAERPSSPNEEASLSSHQSTGSGRHQLRAEGDEPFARKGSDADYPRKSANRGDSTNQLVVLIRKHEEILNQQTAILDQQTSTIGKIAEVLAEMREENREYREMMKKILK